MMVTEQGMRDWTAASGRNWDQLCQAWIWNICDQFGAAYTTYASALDAYYASPIVSSDVWSAPPGAIIYFDIGAYGHVSTRIDDGRDGMASGRVREFWGINAGETDLGDYIAQTGAYPLGWSWHNGVNTYPFEPAGGTPAPSPEEDDVGDFNTIRDEVGSIFFADIWGGESILDYFDTGVGNAEGIDAVTVLGGPTIQVSNRQRDVILSVVNNRRNAYIDAIADAVIRKQQGGVRSDDDRPDDG